MSRRSGAHCFVERSSQYCGWVAGEAVAETLKAVGEELAQMCLSDSAEWRHSGTRTAELLGFSLEILNPRQKVYQKFKRIGKDTHNTNNQSSPGFDPSSTWRCNPRQKRTRLFRSCLRLLQTLRHPWYRWLASRMHIAQCNAHTFPVLGILRQDFRQFEATQLKEAVH